MHPLTYWCTNETFFNWSTGITERLDRYQRLHFLVLSRHKLFHRHCSNPKNNWLLRRLVSHSISLSVSFQTFKLLNKIYKSHHSIRILNPLVNGDYPETMKKNVGSRLPSFTGNQSQLVKGSFDYIGINHYSSIYVKDSPNALDIKLRDFNFDSASYISSN